MTVNVPAHRSTPPELHRNRDATKNTRNSGPKNSVVLASRHERRTNDMVRNRFDQCSATVLRCRDFHPLTRKLDIKIIGPTRRVLLPCRRSRLHARGATTICLSASNWSYQADASTRHTIAAAVSMSGRLTPVPRHRSPRDGLPPNVANSRGRLVGETASQP
jgi:hypothetical protein